MRRCTEGSAAATPPMSGNESASCAREHRGGSARGQVGQCALNSNSTLGKGCDTAWEGRAGRNRVNGISVRHVIRSKHARGQCIPPDMQVPGVYGLLDVHR